MRALTDTPVCLSPQVAEQLRKLRTLGDRRALSLFLAAIDATTPPPRKGPSPR